MVQIDARNGRCHDRPSSSLRRLARTIATPGLSAGSEHETIGRLRGLGAIPTCRCPATVSSQQGFDTINDLVTGQPRRHRIGNPPRESMLIRIGIISELICLPDFCFVLFRQHAVNFVNA